MRTFFINSKTYMVPNMNYSQVVPDGPEPDWEGSKMGVLDTHGLLTLLSATELVAQSNGSSWTTRDTYALRSWVDKYRKWMETSVLGKEEGQALNNHGR